MCSQWAALAMSAVAILATVAKPLAPPTTGWSFTANGGVAVLPFTATQCQPFYIFYNTRVDGAFLQCYDITNSNSLFTIDFPIGVGYLEWICNIPAGFAFGLDGQNYVVKAGSSSACLGDLNTTYSLLTYSTTDFASYTQYPFPLITPPIYNLPTASFPIGAFSTITLNSNLAVTPTTSPPSSSTPTSTSSSLSSLPLSSSTISVASPSSSPTLSSSRYLIIGVVVGAVLSSLLAFSLIILLCRRRRRRNTGLQHIHEAPVDRAVLLATIARAELTPEDRQAIASVNNMFAEGPSTPGR